MTASINLQKVQVFIKESHKKMKNQFILQRINQPALGLDQISLDATINIPQSDEDEVNKVPSVEVNVDINELSQRLDVTLMRLIVRVSNRKYNVFENFVRFKIMDSRYPNNSASKRSSRLNNEG